MASRIVNVKRLKKCKLWSGSLLEMEFKYGGLSIGTVQTKMLQLKAADDRTPAENELLKALEDTLADHMKGMRGDIHNHP